MATVCAETSEHPPHMHAPHTHMHKDEQTDGHTTPAPTITYHMHVIQHYCYYFVGRSGRTEGVHETRGSINTISIVTNSNSTPTQPYHLQVIAALMVIKVDSPKKTKIKNKFKKKKNKQKNISSKVLPTAKYWPVFT